ncbi:hypothetical protein D3C72_2045940 [compost metagenome]
MLKMDPERCNIVAAERLSLGLAGPAELLTSVVDKAARAVCTCAGRVAQWTRWAISAKRCRL